MNVYLIGYRGTGKSTVAPLLARLLGGEWSSADLDHNLERRAGRSIAEIFAADGEACFRDLEQAVLADAAKRDRLVVATGGGVVGREANRRLLKQGRVAWLTASADVIERRLVSDRGRSRSRPKLTTLPERAEIEGLLAERQPLYRQLADLTVTTDQLSAPEIAQAILDAWPDLASGHR